MDILLLGGTGAIGSHLSHLLSQAGHNIYITSRKPHNNEFNIQYVVGNAKNVDFLTTITNQRKWDSIVDFMCYSTIEFEERIKILLGNTRQYVFLSSSRVYSNSKSKITENSSRLLEVSSDADYLKTDEYALYKAREENILFASEYTNYIILRPYITYGEYRLPLGIWEKETWLKRALSGKDIAMPRKFLERNTTIAYGRDASSFIAKLVGNSNANGEIYNIVSDTSQTWNEIANIYIDEINKRNRSNIKIVKFNQCCYSIKHIIKSILYIMHIYKTKYGQYSWNNYQLIYDREFDRRFDNAKTKKLLPNFLFGCNDDNLRKCIREFMNAPKYDYNNYIWEIVQDKITGEKTKLSYFPNIKYKILYVIIRYLIPSGIIYSK